MAQCFPIHSSVGTSLANVHCMLEESQLVNSTTSHKPHNTWISTELWLIKKVNWEYSHNSSAGELLLRNAVYIQYQCSCARQHVFTCGCAALTLLFGFKLGWDEACIEEVSLDRLVCVKHLLSALTGRTGLHSCGNSALMRLYRELCCWWRSKPPHLYTAFWGILRFSYVHEHYSVILIAHGQVPLPKKAVLCSLIPH